ncbi:MAG: hypothetical protein AB9856_06715 [Cellulosilyticaceae bacterium]
MFNNPVTTGFTGLFFFTTARNTAHPQLYSTVLVLETARTSKHFALAKFLLRDINPTDLRKNLAADALELKKILTDAGYDRSTINRQLKELIRQNEATGNFIKK